MSERPSWLTTDFVAKAIGLVVTVAGLYYGIAHRVDALGARVDSANAKVGELSESIREIRQSLPNREADKLVVAGIAERVQKLEGQYEKVETYIQTMREKLAERGWKP